jgi:sugar lactone lactonase YvrE/uncharacterized protein GlcG (DUF336 family)
MKIRLSMAILFALLFVFPQGAHAQETDPAESVSPCDTVPSHEDLRQVLKEVVASASNGGFGLHMWGTVVDRDGTVCAVAFSGEDRGDQWPGSRVISAQKANTANAFSLPGLALSTGNLFTAVQPGNSLFGLQHSNPVDTSMAYGGNAAFFGQVDDPMVGNRIGGVNVFGGGLGLYNSDGILVGAVGVSGDSSCTDHIIAWKVRDALNLDYVPGGVSETGDDNLVYNADSGWAHAECGLGEVPITADLPNSHPVNLVASVSLMLDPDLGQLPEGIAVDEDNNIYLGMAPTGEIIKVTPDGESAVFATLPSPGDGFMTGMIFDNEGQLFVGLASFDPATNGVYRVSPDGSTVDQFAVIPPEGLPNGLDFDSAGNLYVSDSVGGQIWKIDSSGDVTTWSDDELLLGIVPAQPPLNITVGVNGVAFDPDQSNLYAANLEMGRIVRIPMNEDGSAGQAETFVEDASLVGADGIEFDQEGNLFVLVILQDSVLKITPDGNITVVTQGGALQNPASLAFGRGDEANTLYITNYAVLHALEIMPGAPEPGLLVLPLR